MKIIENTKISFRNIQDVLVLLPDAVMEIHGGGIAFNPHRAAHLITGVASNQNNNSFFCVAVNDNDEVLGFLGGYVDYLVYADYMFAQDIMAYVKPSARDTMAYVEMTKAFAQWAKEKGAKEVRGILLNNTNAQKISDASSRYGYEKSGIVVIKKLGDE